MIPATPGRTNDRSRCASRYVLVGIGIPKISAHRQRIEYDALLKRSATKLAEPTLSSRNSRVSGVLLLAEIVILRGREKPDVVLGLIVS
jgi:hypothetical protein